jgi:hypothetical protein
MQRWRGGAPVMSLPSKADFTAIWRVQAGDEIEQRRLAGAVRPDNAERFALRDVEMREVDRFQRAE